MAQDTNTVEVSFWIDKDLKDTVESTCAQAGMSLTTAIIIFCEKVVQEGRIPFEITTDLL